MPESKTCPKCGHELPANAPSGICPKCLIGAGLDSVEESEAAGNEFEQTVLQTGRFVLPNPAALAPHFPHLEIGKLLGHGGMGAVYKARQTKLDRLVAVKIIRPEAADDPSFAERFHREARTLARLSHPNIVAVYDFGEVTLSKTEGDDSASQTLYYFLMEYVDGASLRQLLAGGELTSEQALDIVPQICEALQFAHDESIVHRDIKPENILVDRRGRVKIADFGLAKLVSNDIADNTLTGTYQVMGTPRYMAPEQMEGAHAVDHRADIYSLGVVFYEMLTGELPLGRFDPPSRKATLDKRWDEVVLRALEKEPQRRYQHASEVKLEVEKLSADMQIAQPRHSKETDAREMIAQLLRAPSIGLIVAGAINCLCMLPWTVFAYFGMVANRRIIGGSEEEMMIWLFSSAVSGIPILFASLKMRQLEAYRLVLLGAIMAILPLTPGALFGLPMGLWALAILTRKDVRREFQSHNDEIGKWK